MFKGSLKSHVSSISDRPDNSVSIDNNIGIVSNSKVEEMILMMCRHYYGNVTEVRFVVKDYEPLSQ